MTTSVSRQSVDLTMYPELVVIYLGMRVNTLAGLKTLFRLGPQIDRAGRARPNGLLHFENRIIFSMFPFHVGMRWYWRDFESMEHWTRSSSHSEWWRSFLKNSGGTGFWHEMYYMGGGMEAIYDDVVKPVGFRAFAPTIAARGASFSARRRLGREGDAPKPPDGLSETELY
jgi:Monooxygenase af470-like